MRPAGSADDDRASQRDEVFRPVWFIAQQEMVLFGFFSFCALLASVLFVGHPRTVISEAGAGGTAALVLIWLWLSIRCARTAIRFTSTGIAFHDLRHSGELTWSEIRSSDVVRAHPFPPVQIQPFTALQLSTDQDRHVLFGTCLLSRTRRDELAEAFGAKAPNGRRLEELTKAKLSTLTGRVSRWRRV